MNDIPKIVFSKTLQRADWKKTWIARGELAHEIAELRPEGKATLVVKSLL